MALPQIDIGGGPVAEALLASVDVSQQLNHHWWCTIVVRQTEDERIPIEEQLGKPVEIKTLDDTGVEHIHFSGFVYSVRLVYEVWGSYTAHLVAVSHSYKLDMTPRKQYYADKTLSSIAGTIAGRDGVAVAVNTPGSKALNYVQYGETDFSFLHRLVDDYGAWLRPKDGGLEVLDAFQSGTTIQWRAEDGLIDFSLNGTLAPASFGGSHYDHHAMASSTFAQQTKAPQFYDGAERLTGAVQSASQQLPAGFEPQRARAMTLDNYQDQLQAEGERSMGAAVTGTGQSRNQNLKAGDTVTIDGVLDGKGTYGLIRVAHQWTPQGYTNHFSCTPWKNFRNSTPPAARTWNGIVSARVVDHHDPKKMGRIKVQFFWQQDGSTHWARATSPHAGPDRGFMFMPEIGDEVAVAFEDGDPERPVILGALWNGVQSAPRGAFFAGSTDIAENNVKRILTKSGNRLQMVDEPGKETATLATPNHTALTMTEKHDSTGRTLIHLHSDGDIILTAPNGRVHIQSQFFSREIGSPGKAEAGAADASPATPAPALAAPPKEGFIAGLAGGLYDSTLKPLGHMIAHPIQTAEGIGHVIAHPINTAKAAGHAIAETGRGIASGDGRSIGTAVGTVGMLFVPGAGEAEAAEDVARVGKLGELAEGADAASNVSKGAEVVDKAEITAGESTTKDVSALEAATRQDQIADAYRAHNIDEDKLPSYVSGTDLSKPVTHPVLRPGDSFDMWVRDNGVPGIHGTPPGTDPATLGIKTTGRHLEQFTVKEGETLPVTQSTAADFGEGVVPGVGGTGGGLQQILPPDWQTTVTKVSP